MDYKKKYERAIENLKKIKAANKDSKELVDFIEYEYPELKESIDGKIKKVIKQVLNESTTEKDECYLDNGVTQQEVFAWLEKQGEQKTEIKYIYPKFRVGDVIEPAKPNGYSVPVRVKYIGEGYYSCESDDCKSFLSFPVCDGNKYVLTEQKSTWSEEDEHILEAIIKEIEANKTAGPEYDEKVYDMFLSWLNSLKKKIHLEAE